MGVKLVLLLAALLLVAPVVAQQAPTCAGLTAYAFETLTVSTTALGLTATNFSNVKAVQVSVKTAAIVYRIDGGTPTASVGHPVAAGKTVLVCGENNVRNFLAIRSGGADATLDVALFR